MPLTGDIGVYVREAGTLDDGATFRLFRVSPGEGVVLESGVWHGAPLALEGTARAIVLILEGTGATDVEIARFDPRRVLVVPAGG